MNAKARTQARGVVSDHAAFHTLEGDGFEVRRAIPTQEFEAIGPIVFLDHFGPIDVRPGEAKGASAHPHAGIETLTLLLDGGVLHKDSLGNVSSMKPGEVQWLRSGRGVIHDESPSVEMRRVGGRLHGVQLWINMPKANKHDEPSYRHVRVSEIPILETANGRGRTRLIAGRTDGQVGPITTMGAPFVAHVSLTAGGEVVLAPETVDELAAYVMVGAVGIAGYLVEAGHLVRLSSGQTISLSGQSDSEVILIGGDALDSPIFRYGPFVMSSAADLECAVRDYQSGRMGGLPLSRPSE